MRGREKIPHATIPVFVPHLGCPHRCSFCSQGVISGVEGAPTPQEAAERWGNTEAFLESREKHKDYTPEKEAQIQAEMEEIFAAFGRCAGPEGEEAQALARRRAEAEQELQVNGHPIELREDLQEVYIRMGEDKRRELMEMLEKTRGTMDRSPDKLYSSFIRSVFMRFLLEQQMVMEDAAVDCEETDPDLALLYRDISLFKDADVPRAAALIASGKVSLNHRECLKTDRPVAEGDVLTCRGLGKCVVKEVPGQSKKGRTMLVIERYV